MAEQKVGASVLDKILKYSDIMLAVGIITIVIMMVIPLPTFLLDLLLSLNIAFSLAILLICVYTKDALEISVFPSLLLVVTLFRLALNVSSTRLILLEGYAGEVIMAFGNFVVGGNAVIGFIMFVILIIIQFMVITKGAERVSEVAARFTLDAMPGKQMAIDADLNAGMINETEARARREKIQNEANFYGAMDGASKFVKGDAIAAIIIIVINIVGGFIIGIWQKNLGLAQALQNYTLLTVGEGLVNQIPALLISTATGLIVTRSASQADLGTELFSQLFTKPRIFYIVAGVLTLLGLVPGLPFISFVVLAIISAGIGYALSKMQAEEEESEVEKMVEQEQEEVRKPENIISLLQVDLMELEIGYSLIPIVDVNQGGDLLDRIVMIRRQCAMELGIVVPTIRIRDNIQLKPSAYVMKIRGAEVARGDLYIDHYLAMNPGGDIDDIAGIETVEPAFGLPALWIPESEKEQAEFSGYTVVDSVSVLATHITEIIKVHAYELIGRQEVQALVDNIKQTYPAVVDELVPALLGVGEIHKVLAALLKERVSVRDMLTVLETLADYAQLTKDPEMLSEYVRHALSRQITNQYVVNNVLTCVTVDPNFENQIGASVQRTEHGSYVSLDPHVMQTFMNRLGTEVVKLTKAGYQPIVLTNPAIRLYFRKLTERAAPNLIVLSYAEIENRVEVQSLGMVRI